MMTTVIALMRVANERFARQGRAARQKFVCSVEYANSCMKSNVRVAVALDGWSEAEKTKCHGRLARRELPEVCTMEEFTDVRGNASIEC